MSFIVLVVVLIIWSLVEQKLIVTTKHLVSSSKLGKEFHDTSFVVLADLHDHTFGKNNKRLISKINELSPDSIIIAGDMITKEKKCIPSNAYSLLEELAKNYKIYYTYGNHEQNFEQFNSIHNHQMNKADGTDTTGGDVEQFQGHRSGRDYKDSKNIYSTWVEYKSKLTELGVVFLENRSVTINKGYNSIRITGVSIDREYFERTNIPMMNQNYIDSLVGNSEKNAYQILLAHNPLYFKAYLNWGADLTISGHLHGGLIRLPFLGGMISPQVKFFPKYDAGKFTDQGKEMIVSRGLGSHSHMLRLFNRPELIYIKLCSTK